MADKHYQAATACPAGRLRRNGLYSAPRPKAMPSKMSPLRPLAFNRKQLYTGTKEERTVCVNRNTHTADMTNHPIIPKDISSRFDVHEARNGLAVLSAAHPHEWQDILKVLGSFQLLKTDIETPGGRKSPIAEKLDGHFYKLGWEERKFDTKILVDEQEFASPTHKIDCFKNRVAVEIEWNNKDPFYDRDLNNFRMLFELRAMDVGVIVTRCSELQEIFKKLGRGESYGASTTHLGRLLPRLDGGAGGGCPIAVFGIRKAAYVEE